MTAEVTMPPLVTIPQVDIVATGTWQLSSGEATFTTADLANAVEASQCPAVGDPVIKLGHIDPRFDGQPAVGRVTNLGLAASGNKLTGDLAGLPGWLGAVCESAYPARSIEGAWDFGCQNGHVHPFVITALALLGTQAPGVGVLKDLGDIAALYGVSAARRANGSARAAWELRPGGQMSPSPVLAGTATTVEDVRRAYYDAGGTPLSMWITEMQLDPPQLIVADDATSKVYRVPVKIKDGAVEFGDPAEVEVQYVDVGKAAAGAWRQRVTWATAADSRIVTAAWNAAQQVKNMGDNPAAAAIKKMFALPGDSKSSSKLPHHDCPPGGTVGAANPDGCSAAIGVVNGAHGGVKGVSAADLKKAYSHLARHVTDAGNEPPEYKGPSAGAVASHLTRLRAVRAAAGADLDDNASALVASLDATLDSASALVAGLDKSSLDPKVAQALDLLVAAEAVADDLMDLLGIDDPDDDDVAAGGPGKPDPRAADAAGMAVPGHGPATGQHGHPHSAYGSQGADLTHAHPHSHDGDARHRPGDSHQHAPAALAAAPGNEGGSEVEFTSDQQAQIRAALGLQDGEELTPQHIAAAFASANGQPPVAKPAPGVIAVDASILKDYRDRAEAGDQAVEQMRTDESESVLAAALRDGKFPQVRLDHYRALWRSDPDGARQVIASLAPGLVPVGPKGRPGLDPELPGDFEQQQAYRDLYPEDAKAANGRG